MSSDMIEILVLILIAGVVLYRLKTVIGTRTGHEGPTDFVRRQQDGGSRSDAPAGPVAVPDIDEPDEERHQNLPEGSRGDIIITSRAHDLRSLGVAEPLRLEEFSLSEAKTLSGQKVKIDASNGVKVNDSKVVTADVHCSNGVIHIIDRVLLPPTK